MGAVYRERRGRGNGLAGAQHGKDGEASGHITDITIVEHSWVLALYWVFLVYYFTRYSPVSQVGLPPFDR